jgi:hypothetical protein
MPRLVGPQAEHERRLAASAAAIKAWRSVHLQDAPHLLTSEATARVAFDAYNAPLPAERLLDRLDANR